jgi:hypothetical protein
MPFFANNEWLGDASRFWVWVILTVPSTALAFAFYIYWKRHNDARNGKMTLPESDFELGEGFGLHTATIEPVT